MQTAAWTTPSGLSPLSWVSHKTMSLDTCDIPGAPGTQWTIGQYSLNQKMLSKKDYLILRSHHWNSSTLTLISRLNINTIKLTSKQSSKDGSPQRCTSTAQIPQKRGLESDSLLTPQTQRMSEGETHCWGWFFANIYWFLRLQVLLFLIPKCPQCIWS